jgi:hypothetical protein
VPYTSAQFGISGVVPKGWVEVKPGQFQRLPAADPTLLGQVMFSDATVERVIDHGQLPKSVGSRETASLTWNLYNVELEWLNAGTLVWDGALTEGDTGVYMIVLVTLAAEHEPLYDAVFVPAVDSLVPAMITEEQAAAAPATPAAEGLAPINTRIRPTDGMVMVYVPAGEFDMGNAGVQWIWGGSLRDGDLDLQVFTDE